MGTVGRIFEAWRAPLAVARLLERHGVPDLEAIIRKIMVAAPQEKAEAPRDYTTNIVEAIGSLAFGPLDMLDNLDNLDMSTEVVFTASDVVQKIKSLADEAEEVDTEWASSQKVGLILSNLRVPKKRDGSSTKRTRLKALSLQAVLDMLLSYGLLPGNMSNMSNMSNDMDGADSSTSETSEYGPQPNGHDSEADTPANSREQQLCRYCHKSECTLTPGGQFCRLSEEDKQRWSEPGFSDDARDEDDISDEGSI